MKEEKGAFEQNLEAFLWFRAGVRGKGGKGKGEERGGRIDWLKKGGIFGVLGVVFANKRLFLETIGGAPAECKISQF